MTHSSWEKKGTQVYIKKLINPENTSTYEVNIGA